MLIEARLSRLALFGTFGAALTLAACSGSSTPVAPQCDFQYVGSASAIYGSLVAPASGATGVPLSTQTLVFNEAADFAIVLETTGGASTSIIKATPTALPSPYQTNSPGTSTVGYYAVSVTGLQADTTYAAGTLSNDNECANDYKFYQFGTFTTE
jgi:hypothetical protein